VAVFYLVTEGINKLDIESTATHLLFDELTTSTINSTTFHGNYTWDQIASWDAKTLLEDVSNKVYGSDMALGGIAPAPNEVIVKAKNARSKLSVKWEKPTPTDYTKTAKTNAKHSGSKTSPGITCGVMAIGASGYISEQMRAVMELGTYHAAAGGESEIFDDLATNMLGIDDFALESLLPVMKGNWIKRSQAKTTLNKVMASDEALENVDVNLDALKTSMFDEDEAFDFGAANVSALYLAKMNSVFEPEAATLPVMVVDRAAVVIPEESFKIPDGIKMSTSNSEAQEEYDNLTKIEEAHSQMLTTAANYLQEISSSHSDEVHSEYMASYTKMLIMNIAEKNQARVPRIVYDKDDVIEYSKQPKFKRGADTPEIALINHIKKVIGTNLLRICLNDDDVSAAWWELGHASRTYIQKLSMPAVQTVVKAVFNADLLSEIHRDTSALPIKIDDIKARTLRYFAKTFDMPIPPDAKDFPATVYTHIAKKSSAFVKYLYACWLAVIAGKYDLHRHTVSSDSLASIKALIRETKQFINNRTRYWHKHYESKWKGAKNKRTPLCITAQVLSKWFKSLDYDHLVAKKSFWFGDTRDNPFGKTILKCMKNMEISVPAELKHLTNLIAWADTLKKTTVSFKDLWDSIETKTAMLYDDLLRYIAALGGLPLEHLESFMMYPLPVEDILPVPSLVVEAKETRLLSVSLTSMAFGSIDDVLDPIDQPEWPNPELGEEIALKKGFDSFQDWFDTGDDAAYWGSEACTECILAHRVALSTTGEYVPDEIMDGEEDDVVI